MAPSPDLTEYIDLPLVDKDPQDVFEAAILNMQVAIPEWEPREGNIEVLLLENIALEVAEAIFAINRLPSTITEILLSLFDIERDNGAPPTANIRFDLGISTGTTIPAGVSVVLELESGLDPIVFTTDSELVIPPSETYGIVSATGDRFTSDANDIPADTLLELQESISTVNYAKLATAVTGGRDPEEDIDYLSRGIQRLQRLTTTLLLPRQFEAAAIEYPFVKRVKALDNYNSAGDVGADGPVGADPGYIAVAVYGDNENVSTENKDILLSFFEANAMSNLVITIINPTITTVNVTAQIRIDADALASDVVDAVEEALGEFLDPMTWPWTDKVRKNEIISIITNVPGVDYLDTLTTPSADVTLPGVANLAKAGTLNITVVSD